MLLQREGASRGKALRSRRMPGRRVRTRSRTAHPSGLPRQSGTSTALAPGPAARSQSNAADHLAAGAQLQEPAQATPQRPSQQATQASKPLRKQQRRDHEYGQQQRDHHPHSVLGTHNRCPARTVSAKTANANTVSRTNTTSATSDPDSGPHACYPTSVPGSRQATFTRLIRGVVRFSRNFYALGRPRDVQQVMSTLVNRLKVTEMGVAMMMITADRSHSAAMAQLSLPSASVGPVPVV